RGRRWRSRARRASGRACRPTSRASAAGSRCARERPVAPPDAPISSRAMSVPPAPARPGGDSGPDGPGETSGRIDDDELARLAESTSEADFERDVAAERATAQARDAVRAELAS